MKKNGLIIWSLLRLPILAAGLYLFRNPISDFVKARIELRYIIDFAVYSANTFETRFELYLACVIAMAVGYWLVKKWIASEVSGYILTLVGMLLVIFASFQFLLVTPNALGRTLIVFALLAVNTMPMEWLTKRISGSGILNLVFLAGVGLSEAIFPQAYTFWLMEKFQAGVSIKKWSWLSGVLIAPLFWLFLLTPYDNQRILTLGEKLHASPSVEKFAAGAYNWIEYDANLHQIFVVGHGTNFLLAFDTEHLNVPPRKSRDIGKMQSFGYNPERQEIYAYEANKRALHYINAVTLETLRSVPVTDLSPGDVWVNWRPGTDCITIASEADYEVGIPFVMIDRESGETIATMPLPLIPTNVAFHPEKDIMYFNSFKDTYLISWDLNTHEIIKQVETSPNTDRLIYNPSTSEALVASTMEGAILRYDSETLEYKGKINVSIGDRTMTIDPKRNLLLVGNFINNRAQVIDLKTYEPIASFYIGPWIRTISLDVENGIAYVSTVRNLFKVKYISE
jgi:DNA-binding beta-propeller fold protein YncE